MEQSVVMDLAVKTDDAERQIHALPFLKRVLRRALDAYFEELDAWTVADIVANRKAITSELRPPQK